MESRSLKVGNFFMKHTVKIHALLTLAYFGMAVLNGYTAINSYQAGDYKVAAWDAFSSGMFLSTGMFFTIFMYQLVSNRRAWKQCSMVIMENHALKQEILISKIPELAKQAKTDNVQT